MGTSLGWVLALGVLAGCGGGSGPKPDPVVDDAVAYLAKDTQIVVGIDVAQFRTGPLAATFRASLTKDDDYLAGVLKGCSVDPVAVVDRAVVGVSNLGASPDATIVLKGHDQKKLLECFARGEGAMRDGDVVAFWGGLTLMAVDDSTLLGITSPSATPDVLRARAKRAKGLTDVPAFMALYRTIDTHRAMWLAARGAVLEKMDMEPAPRSITASLAMGKTIAIGARVRFESAGDATEALDRYGRSLETKPGVGTAKITQAGADVVIDLSLTAEATSNLLDSARDPGGW